MPLTFRSKEGSPTSIPMKPRRALAMPSTEYMSGRSGKMSMRIVSPSTPSCPTPIMGMVSSSSSRGTSFPSRDSRSR